MTSKNPFKEALGWIVVLSFIIRLLDVTKYNHEKKTEKKHRKTQKKPLSQNKNKA